MILIKELVNKSHVFTNGFRINPLETKSVTSITDELKNAEKLGIIAINVPKEEPKKRRKNIIKEEKINE